MKKKYLLFLAGLFMVLSSYSQTKQKAFEIIFPIEQKLQQLAPMMTGNLSQQQIAGAFQQGGVLLSSQGVNKMKQGLQALEMFTGSPGSYNTPAAVKSLFAANGINLDNAEAKIIFDHVKGGPKVGPNAHVFLMALVAKRTNAKFAQFIEDIVREANRPSRPDSPSRRSIGRVVDRALSLTKIILPKPSGDWFGNAYTSIGYTYTRFDDIANNGSGQEDITNLTVGGDIGGNTSLSFSLSHQKSHRGGESQLTYEAYGTDLLIHHKINEYFGAGAYGFYQMTDIEENDGDVYGTGGGLLLSGFYDFGFVDVTMIHTWNKVWYQYGHDQLYVGSLNVNRNWNDWLSTYVTCSYTDSLKHDQIGDNSYWTVGGGFYLYLTENATFSAGYERVVALTDYRSHSFNFNFIWNF